MALPKLASAKYELTLPSTGEKVEYRPFLVREEKILLLAQQSGDQKDILRAVEVVSACTFEKLNSKKLPFFDLEYVFLQLRSKSIGEKTQISVICPDDKTTRVSVEVDLATIECTKELGHDSNIKLTDTIGIIMDYPRVTSMISMDGLGDTEAAFSVIKSCIKQIYDADNFYDAVDMDKTELDEFVGSMTHQQFEKVQEFFATMPKVKKLLKVKNPNTGVESEVLLEGLNAFFQ